MDENYFDELPNGGRFYRADLHIHSYGFDDGSFDVKDENMTPENIVDKAIENGLSIISITDHNEVNNSKKAIDYSMDKDIFVIPGIEVSTTQGHLLCYFPSHQKLRRFHGKLNIAENKETCNQGIVQCLELAQQFDGIGILAHIELESSGFENAIGKFGPVMSNILNHGNLFGLEIVKKENQDLYTDSDADPNRKHLISERRRILNLTSDYNLAKLMCSDAHTLTGLGTNASGDKRLTRIKMDTLSFSGFKNALTLPESRIRLENYIPESIPHFVGIQFEGGLLDGQIVHFSKNLTCVIGGRGTGKSTLLQSIREASGNPSGSNVVDSDVWSQNINLIFQDITGKRTRFVREKNSQHFNITDGDNGVDNIPIEIYGQGAAAETIQHSDENPQILLDILDDFVDLEILKEEDDRMRREIIANKSEIDSLKISVATIPSYQKVINDRKGKMTRLKKDKVGDLVKFHDALNKEKEFRESLIENIKLLKDTYKDILSDTDLFDSVSKLSDQDIEIGKDEFTEVKSIVAKISDFVETKSSELNTELELKLVDLREQIRSWKSKELTIQKSIDAKKAELKAQGIPFDIGEINQLSNDLIRFEKELAQILKNKTKLQQILKIQKDIIQSRVSNKSKIFQIRKALAKELNNNLKNTVEGLEVHIDFHEGKLSSQFNEHIKNLLGYKTSRVNKASIIADIYSPSEFKQAIITKNLKKLENVEYDGKQIFSKNDIQQIIDVYSLEQKYNELDALIYDDKPSITVIKKITGPDDKPKILKKSLTKLSLGQQQSIFLAILLHSKSKYPLLIDQPEDNLDSEFVYKTIVANLRKIKEKRQVIIVTHNANIAVLSDAELIIPLKSTSEKSIVVEKGSIDKKEIRKLCCDILEGGERAFKYRKELYNL